MSAQDKEQKTEAKKENKPRQISFRMSEDDYQKAETQAAARKMTVHDWCRQMVQDRLNSVNRMTPVEELLHYQLSQLRYMLGRVFSLQVKEEFTEKTWKEIRQQLDANGVEIAEDVMTRYISNCAASHYGRNGTENK